MPLASNAVSFNTVINPCVFKHNHNIVSNFFALHVCPIDGTALPMRRYGIAARYARRIISERYLITNFRTISTNYYYLNTCAGTASHHDMPAVISERFLTTNFRIISTLLTTTLAFTSKQKYVRRNFRQISRDITTFRHTFYCHTYYYL